MAKILLVEDDLELAERLQDWLTLENHTVELVYSGEDALQMLESYVFDVIVLDWGLPAMNGIDVCKRYRAQGGKTAMIFLTGRGDVDSRITGLDTGADDYLVKPFEMAELSARIRSLARRPNLVSVSVSIDGVVLETETRTLKVGGQQTVLKPKECALLEYLMRHPNRHYSAKQLLSAVWPSDTDASEGTVRTNMKTLRRQLEEFGKEDFVKTELGLGYFIEQKG